MKVKENEVMFFDHKTFNTPPNKFIKLKCVHADNPVPLYMLHIKINVIAIFVVNLNVSF